MKLTRIVGIGLLIFALSAVSLVAAPGAPNGPKPKLEAPAVVTCTLSEDPEDGTVATVTWTAVDGAFSYQVESFCTVEGLHVPLETSVFPLAPATSVGLSVPDACVTDQVHVRGIPEPKSTNPNHPPQGTGPKGEWSDLVTCVEEVPVFSIGS